jgi:hypothetical protein
MTPIVKPAFISLFLLGVLAPSPTHAAALRCDRCLASGYEVRAINQGPGQHLVFDRHHNKVHRFDVHFDPTLNRNVAVQRDVHPEMVALVDALSAYYRETHGALRKTVDLDASDIHDPRLQGRTAMDVASDFVLRTRLGDLLREASPETFPALASWAGITAIVARTGTPVEMLRDVAIDIRVTMSDRSTAVYRGEGEGWTMAYQPDSSRLADGQAIIEANAAKYAGKWRFGSDGQAVAQAYVDYLQNTLHIPVSVVGASIGELSCAWNRERESLVCLAG